MNNIKSKPSYMKVLFAVVWKDMIMELRSREMLSAMLVFALLVVLIFNFAFELDATTRANTASGVLWVTFAFAGTLGLNRSMAMEKDYACLDGLLMAPVDRSAIFFGKVLGNFIFMVIVELIVLPIFSVLYGINLFHQGFIFVVLLGSLGYIIVGSLLSSMTVQTRTRDILLPILLFPVAIPIFIAAVRASRAFLVGTEMVEVMPYLNLLIVYDIVFFAVAYMVFDFIVQE